MSWESAMNPVPDVGTTDPLVTTDESGTTVVFNSECVAIRPLKPVMGRNWFAENAIAEPESLSSEYPKVMVGSACARLVITSSFRVGLGFAGVALDHDNPPPGLVVQPGSASKGAVLRVSVPFGPMSQFVAPIILPPTVYVTPQLVAVAHSVISADAGVEKPAARGNTIAVKATAKLRVAPL